MFSVVYTMASSSLNELLNSLTLDDLAQQLDDQLIERLIKASKTNDPEKISRIILNVIKDKKTTENNLEDNTDYRNVVHTMASSSRNELINSLTTDDLPQQLDDQLIERPIEVSKTNDPEEISRIISNVIKDKKTSENNLEDNTEYRNVVHTMASSSRNELLNSLTTGDLPQQLDDQLIERPMEVSKTNGPEEISRIISNVIKDKKTTENNLEDNTEYRNGVIEEKAYLNFFEKFEFKYGIDHVPFKYCLLHQAIKYSCLAPVEYRKLLILYLHNENDDLSKLICPSLIKGEIYNVLERSFDVLAWDLMSIEVGTFDAIIDEWPDLQIVKNDINEKRAGLFVLFPTEDTVTIISKWNNHQATLNNIQHSLEALEKISFFTNIEHTEKKPDVPNVEEQIGSKEFQQMMFDRLGNRDYDSFELNEHDFLKEKIGYSKFGPPSSENGYNEKQKQSIEKTYNVIIKHSSKHATWDGYVEISFIYNCTEAPPSEKKKRKKKYSDYNEYTDIMPVPIYVIPKCYESANPCRIFVDHDDRVYSSWSEYIEENKLHKCFMVVPKDGRYGSVKEDGAVNLETYFSPACGVSKAILKGTDIASSALGIGAGGVFVLAAIPAITVAPIALGAAAITGAGVGIYSIVRSSMAIHDRRIHMESMSFANSEARGAYLNIVAGSLGFVGMGATTVVSQLAARGFNISTGVKIALNTVNAANVGTGVVNIANSSYDFIDNLVNNRSVSALSIVQLSSSILFFGNAVYNFKSAAVIVNEAQANSMQKIQDSLRSNRHRKTFNKLYRETVRTNDGNVQAAKAEVISTIRSMPNVDETFAVLTRNNKLFNKQGIKFAASDRGITLNGNKVDILNMGSMSKSATTAFLIDLPKAPIPTKEQVQTSNFEIITFLKANFLNFCTYANLLLNGNCLNIISQILLDFTYECRQKILTIFGAVLERFNVCDIPIINMCQDYCVKVSDYPVVTVIRYIVLFLHERINQYEEVYRKKFDHIISHDTAKNAIYWTTQILDIFVNGHRINPFLLEKLFKYIIAHVVENLDGTLQLEEKFSKRIRSSNQKVDCNECKGKFFCS